MLETETSRPLREGKLVRRFTARGSVAYGLVLILFASCATAPPPPTRDSAESPAIPGPASVETANHRVERGETVWRIAQRYDVSVTALIEHNGIREVRRLQVGRVLEIPERDRDRAAAPAESEALEGRAAARDSSRAETPSGASYRVQPGDTLWRIARRHGVVAAALAEGNRIADPRKLRVGQLLRMSAPAPPGPAGEPAAGPPDGPDSPSPAAPERTPSPGPDSVDDVLASGEEHLRAAELDEALARAEEALGLLGDANGEPGAGARIARAEVLAATVHVAYARREAALRSLRRAVRSDAHLQLDLGNTSPKVLAVLDEARSQLDGTGADSAGEEERTQFVAPLLADRGPIEERGGMPRPRPR